MSHPENSFQPESEHLPDEERLSDEQMARLLAGIGNLETKALLLAGMEPGRLYVHGELHDVFMDMQGENPAWVPHKNTTWSYCKETLGPVGAVAQETISRGRTMKAFKLTEFGEVYGKALSGYLLAWSLRHPDIGLQTVLSVTHINHSNDKQHEGQRAPLTRAKIIRQLVSPDGELTTAKVAELCQVREQTVGKHLQSLSQEGLILLDSSSGNTPYVKYQFGDISGLDKNTDWGVREVNVAGDIVDTLRKIAQTNTTISYQEVSEALRNRYPKYESWRRKSLHNIASQMMSRMADRGVLIESKFRKGKISCIEPVPARVHALAQFVGIVDAIQSGDPTILDEGRQIARSIIQNEDSVHGLVEIRQRFSSSSPARRRSPEEWEQLILESIRRIGGHVSINQVVNNLSEKGVPAKRQSLEAYFKELVHDQKLTEVDFHRSTKFYSATKTPV